MARKERTRGSARIEESDSYTGSSSPVGARRPRLATKTGTSRAEFRTGSATSAKGEA
jgi:hypothetical protein